MDKKLHIDLQRVPNHVAIIMDGNGRWAKSKGMNRIFGHRNALTAIRQVADASSDIGIKFLTMYAFSTEHSNRPKFEVNALMELLVNSLSKELPTLMKNNIKLQVIGNTNSLPSRCIKTLNETMGKTSNNSQMTAVSPVIPNAATIPVVTKAEAATGSPSWRKPTHIARAVTTTLPAAIRQKNRKILMRRLRWRMSEPL